MEIFDKLPEWMKWLGAIAGTIAGGALFLRQYLSGAAAERASDSGQIAALDVYKSMVSELRTALAEANARADQFAKERNEAIELAGTLKGQIAELNRQVEGLRVQVGQLMEQLNAKKQI